MPGVHRYSARCHWSGSTAAGYDHYDRTHRGDCPPASTGLTVSADPAFRGDPSALNPEQLVVLAASSCQLLAFLAVASRARIDVRAYEDAAHGTMPDAPRAMALAAITLRPTITVAPGTDLGRIPALVEQAHRECFIANSLACPVTVEPTVVVAGG